MWRNNATLIFEHIYHFFFKAEKRLSQQRNIDCHTSLFYHQKSWKGVTQQRNTYFRTHISFFLKSWEKAEKADATMQHWFLHINILPPKKLRFLLMHESSLMQQCNIQLEPHLWNFGEKKLKRGDATTQHWFSNTYINFFLKAEKRLKRLMQQRNTDFHTSTF